MGVGCLLTARSASAPYQFGGRGVAQSTCRWTMPRRAVVCGDGLDGRGGIPVSRELRDLLHERKQRGDPCFLRAGCHRRHGATDDEGQDAFRPVRSWFPRCGLRRGVGELERCREFQRAAAWRLDGPWRDGMLGRLFDSHRQGERKRRAAVRCRTQGVFLGARHDVASRAVGLDG